jgi:hypothetical protein
MGNKAAQTERGSLFSMPFCCGDGVDIGRDGVLCAVTGDEYRRTRPCNDGHILTSYRL